MSRYLLCGECGEMSDPDEITGDGSVDPICPACHAPLDPCDDYGDYETVSYDGPVDDRLVGPVTPTGGSIR